MSQLPRVVVVGGGISGLTVGYLLTAGIDPGGDAVADVTVLEATDRVGGKLHTIDWLDRRVEVGADAFLARHPSGQALARRVGLGDALVEPATGQVWLWTRGRLRALPAGTVLGAPADPVALLRSRVLSPGGLLRAGIEPLLPALRAGGDRSIADVVGARFGREVVDTLVEPLLGGVYAGRVDELSVDAAAPMVADAARRRRSLLLGLGEHRRATVGSDSGTPVFQTLSSGLQSLPDTLAAALGDRVVRGVRATSVTPTSSGYAVTTDDGATLAADAVVLATPAFVTADLLDEIAPAAASEAAAIRYASVAVITLAYDRAADRELPPGSGMLVPRTEGRLIKASTWVSRKWPHHADAPYLLLRASVGRIDDHAWRDLDEDELIHRVDAEIRWATGIRKPVEHAIVRPWIDSLPQYVVGHGDRIDRLRMHLPKGLLVTGAAYDGVGISPCVASATTTARAVAHHLARRGRPARSTGARTR